MLRSTLSLLLAVSTLIFSMGLQAETVTVIERPTIITKVPEVKTTEVVTAPAGSMYCYYVEGAYFNDVWVPRHQVCQYTKAAEGVVWVEGYWACNKYDNNGNCTNWDWKKAHWAKEYVVY